MEATKHRRRFRVSVLGVLAVLAALFALAAAVLIWIVLGRSTNPLWSRRADVLVPDLLGRTRAAAVGSASASAR